MNNQLLQIVDLSIQVRNTKAVEIDLVKGINLEVNRGEIVGLVGESGSGKSISSLAILGLLDKELHINSGHILFGENAIDLVRINEKEFQKIRGKEISMIFQEPMSSLNPVMTCGKQVDEIMLVHKLLNKASASNRTLELFEQVQIPDPQRAYHAYPHQLSGGQLQRVMIAMALACKPKLLIADECTTALDVTVQKEIVDLLKKLNKDYGISILFISHDLELIKDIADHVVVMRKGEIMEKASVNDLFLRPQSHYTKQLLSSRPPESIPLKKLPKPSFFTDNNNDIKNTLDLFIQENRKTDESIQQRKVTLTETEPILAIKDLTKFYPSKFNFWGKPTSYVKAVNHLSFDIKRGETVGLVGESGCGKSTLSKALLRLIEADSGEVLFRGEDIYTMSSSQLRKSRKRFQYIFQNPYASLNPRFTIGRSIKEPMDVHGIGNSRKERVSRVEELLELVGLEASHFNRYPHQFSGGQRQRICIARALSVNPELIVCDEIVSALDVSVQAQVLNLLIELRDQLNLSLLFVSHDLSIVKFMSDRLLVMKDGEFVERGWADEIYRNPQNEYTKNLLASIPGKRKLI